MTLRIYLLSSRYDQCRGSASGGARLPDAVPARLPQASLRHHAGMLEEGRDGATHIRDPPLETRRVLHARGQPVQRAVYRAIKQRPMHA